MESTFLFGGQEDKAPTTIGGPWWRVASEAAAFEALEELGPSDDYDDSEFGAHGGGEREGAPPGPLVEGVRWLRPAEALGAGAALLTSAGAFVLRPSAVLDDVAVLAAIAAVSTRAELMLRLFESVAHSSRGAYTLSLYSGGAWTPVLLDTTLPVNVQLSVSGERELLCASLAERAPAFAPALLEKAFAKLFGGYSRLAKASVEDAMLALTGGSVSRLVLDDDELAHGAAELVREMRAGYAAGGLVVLKMTPRRAAALKLAAKSIHGLRPDEYYVLVGFAMVGSVAFARMHTPWGSAPWRGVWGPYSGEWSVEIERASALRMERLHNDNPSEWWMPASLLNLFDERVHARIFSKDFTHTALADEWTEATAGGAPTPSSFEALEVLGAGAWATNEQFSIQLDGYEMIPAEMTISVLVERRGGEGEGEEKWVSFHVLRSDTRARMWGIQEKQLVASAGPHSGSEISASFTASPRDAYTLVPSLLRAGQTGRFLVRVWCDRPFSLTKTRPLVLTRVSGSWDNTTAGGPRGRSGWSANPQYWLSLPRRAFVFVTLERTDEGRETVVPSSRKSSLDATELPTQTVGGDASDERPPAADGVGVAMVMLRGEMPVETKRKYLHARSRSPGTTPDVTPRSRSPLRPGSATSGFLGASTRPASAHLRGLDPSLFSTASERDCSKLPHELKLRATPAELVGEARADGRRKCSLLLNLTGDQPYVLVASLLAPGVEGSYTLTLYSSAGPKLEPISQEAHALVNGKWTEKSACGCHLDVWSDRQQRWLRNSRFLSNPQLQLRVSQPAMVRIRLQRGKVTQLGDENEQADRMLLLRSTEKYYASMLGLYVLRGRGLGPAERLRLPARGYAALDVVQEVPFVPLASVEVMLHLSLLPDGAPYVLVPCLFGDGLGASFTLEATCPDAEAGLQLAMVDHELPAAVPSPQSTQPAAAAGS